MLHHIRDLSSDENFPTRVDESNAAASSALAAAALMVALMTMCGCAAQVESESAFPFSTMVLSLWTAVCMLYTWWMLKTSFWEMHGSSYAVSCCRTCTSRTAQHDETQTSLEGLLFFTTRRVLKRLERAAAEGDENRTRKYMQSLTWLGNMLTALPGNGEEREGMIQALTGENSLSEDETSRTDILLMS